MLKKLLSTLKLLLVVLCPTQAGGSRTQKDSSSLNRCNTFLVGNPRQESNPFTSPGSTEARLK